MPDIVRSVSTDTNTTIDAGHKRAAPVGLRVIGAGFGRTGTASLRAALEKLGFGPCLHGADFWGKRRYIRAWLAAARNPSEANWDALLADYRSTQDFPAAAFWRELAEHYPSAKVVLSVRDEQSWYDSVSGTIFSMGLRLSPPMRARVTRVLSATASWLPPYPAMYAEIVYQGVFGGRLDRDGAIAVYRRHNAEVQAALPPDRVLVWRAADGWAPLCRFLDVPVPEEPFPRINDRAAYRGTMRQWPAYVWRRVRGRSS